ncbi:MAG: GIY-YIG nuclease family protein [Pseudomonadota bacterium]
MREEAGGYVYILANKAYGPLYTGSARDLVARIYQHKEGVLPGFTRKYGVAMLVWYEAHESVSLAYSREQKIKKWRRAWKIALIEGMNPRWNDLYPALIQFGAPL